MRLLKGIFFLSLVMVAQGAKVTWNNDGTVNINETEHLIKGCQMADLSSILVDLNESKPCDKP